MKKKDRHEKRRGRKISARRKVKLDSRKKRKKQKKKDKQRERKDQEQLSLYSHWLLKLFKGIISG